MMATFDERLDELIGLLGISQNQFCTRIGKARASYSNWKAGQEPAMTTLMTISRRWHVSIDALMGENGTESLEPSRALRKAQRALLVKLSQKDTPGTEVDRAKLLCASVLQSTGMNIDAWCEWLQISVHDWELLISGTSLPGIVRANIAFLVGWYHEKGAWMDWLSTGQVDTLSPASEPELRRMAETLFRTGYTVDMIRSLSK